MSDKPANQQNDEELIERVVALAAVGCGAKWALMTCENDSPSLFRRESKA